MIVVERAAGTEVSDEEGLGVVLALRERLRCSGVTVVGLLAPTSAALIQAWRACLAEGCTPLILHYPTPKLSRAYWEAEVGHAVHSAGVQLLICSDASCVPAEAGTPVLRLDELPVQPQPALGELPQQGRFLQMSSGTTGHRKAIALDISDVRRHVADYNAVLRLTSEDCIVSWLPLYHDMGLIAAFLMPQIVGCRLVLLDPVEWVRRPHSLWEAIERYGGTAVFMPNFAFEVMASHPRQSPPGIKRWVSCSEPTRGATLTRFAEATGTPLNKLSNCWGMAENVFAVCQTVGVPRTLELDGAEVVSCGPPIPGVEVKVVDGELWVRSPTSLQSYIGVPARIDAEGFYATGDLGRVIDGEVFLQGRSADIVVSAGRKAFLSDLDAAVAELVPGSAGRIAAVAIFDERLGTEIPVVLVEDADFWRRNRDATLLRSLAARTGVETARVEFVPPRFITKTSSGKVNRKITGQHWRAVKAQGASGDGVDRREDARREALDMIPWLDPARPVGEQLDSLGLVNLGLLLARHGFVEPLTPSSPLDTLLGPREPGAAGPVVRIASLCDGNPFHLLALNALWSSGERYGIPLQYQHLCVPPLPVLLSDLVFMDWFAARDSNQGKYESVRRVLADLRSANVVLIDEATALFWPHAPIDMVYPQIAHDFRPDPAAELLGVRWAAYSEGHHHIACQLVPGASLDPQAVNAQIAHLSDYLGVPVVRIAYGRERAEVTDAWEVQAGGDLNAMVTGWDFASVDQPAFEAALLAALDSAVVRAPPREATGYAWVNYQDQPHWCSWSLDKLLVDDALDRFTDIAVLGKPSSIPYLAAEAARRGVRLDFRPDLSVPERCDAVLQTGSWGEPKTDRPVVQLMSAGWAG